MTRGDVVLARFPHPSGVRGKRRPGVVVQAGSYAAVVGTVVVAAITSNVSMAADPACLFIDASASEGKAAGVLQDSVVTCLVIGTVNATAIDQTLGRLSPAQLLLLDDCLKEALGLP